MRPRNIKNAREKLEEFREFVLGEPSGYKGRWREFFGNSNPIHLEIGTGKGKFILESARKHPETNFIGLELSTSTILRAARKIGPDRPRNLCLVNLDARNLGEVFENGELAKIYLNFSDPWPKKRHEKRRLTSEFFLNLYRFLLREGGEIEVKTDNRGFFEYSLVSFNKHHYRFLEVNLDLHANNDEEIITTEYEEKFISLGQTIYFLKVGK